MTETEKIMKLSAVIPPEEKDAIENAHDALVNAFESLLERAKTLLSDNDREREDPSIEPIKEAHRALLLLHEYGSRYGIDFPMSGSLHDTVNYVIHFAGQVIRSRNQSCSE